jgi:hypothetical protein
MPSTPTARFKDLCIDVVDPRLMATFWAAALQLPAEATPNGARLTGATAAHTIWLNQVPEPGTVKQRVHLDIHAGSVAEIEALGARRLSAPGQFDWTVMADPEGGEFCVFERTDVPADRLYEIGVDAADPVSIAQWWAGVFGGRVEDSGRDFCWIEGIEKVPFESLVFAKVPEPKQVKNRVHWDVTAASVPALERAGATVLRRPDDDISWHVFADPDGNEFCVFAP